MIARFLSGSTGSFVLFLLVMGAVWLWNLWDCLRNPQSPPPLRWYHFTEAPSEDRWDLQALNGGYVEPTGEPKAGTQPGPCRR
jgi:hypothetical protein